MTTFCQKTVFIQPGFPIKTLIWPHSTVFTVAPIVFLLRLSSPFLLELRVLEPAITLLKETRATPRGIERDVHPELHEATLCHQTLGLSILRFVGYIRSESTLAVNCANYAS